MDLSGGKRLIGDLKSKLGLGAKQQAPQDYDQAYDDAYYEEGYERYVDDFGDGYGDYDQFEAYGRDYVDDGYDAAYDDGYGYPDDAPRDSRRMNSGTRARNVSRDTGYVGSYDAPRGTRGQGASGMPRLLSIDEVRDRTRASRTVRTEAPSGGFADQRPARASSSAPLPRRSGNFDSMPLHTPEPLPEQPAEGHSGRFLSLLDADPDSPNGDISRIRALTVLKPVRYGEAERITEVLKKDDVAVLDLRGAAKGLDKRILDFSFGAASVLDASVECVADKVFVVCAGGGLTQEERAQLQAQGVI